MKYDKLHFLLFLILIFNIIDISLTVHWCNVFSIDEIEGNPIMGFLLQNGYFFAFAFKIISSCSFIMVITYYSTINYKFSFNTSVIILGIYSSLMIWHINVARVLLNLKY